MSTISFTHPRRTTKSTVTQMADSKPPRPVVNTAMALRKGATFHSPSSSSSDEGFIVPSLPRRSDTTLEDVVDANRRRVALRLGDIERGLLSNAPSSPSSLAAFRDDSLPVPRGLLNHTVGRHNVYEPTEAMESVAQESELNITRLSLRSYQNRRASHGHASDSGLGSSIMSEKMEHKSAVEAKSKASAITRSAAARSSMGHPPLSPRASHRITEHILRPLLAKPTLKDFRPIVRDCPRRINQREIVCLRDLEKTLIFMAPVSDLPAMDDSEAITYTLLRYVKERAKSVELYLDFCLTSIQCIQATVQYLSDREQTRPNDRPYTNGYFIDLVDQIRQYAQQVQAAKVKKEKGESDEMDAEATDEVKLYGGLSRNGRPAELVRMKNGKAISIATGEPVEEEEDSKSAILTKRQWTEFDDDEDILRSMARRKRNATAEELAPKRCREPGCNKEFKRPCDLTKHEKTHSRPWKCPHKDCKFHEQGWPTEKELGRHVNDKHSAAPKYFECQFAPCLYKSKRESNCKQHMEKSHGWTYVRSKNNGKNRPKETSLPQSTMQTPSSDSASIPTPELMDTEMPEVYEGSLYGDNNSLLSHQDEKSTIWDPTQMVDPNQQRLPFQMDFSPISTDLSTGFASSHASPYLMDPMANFPTDTAFNALNGNDFDPFGNEDLYSANVQLPTPNNAVFQRDLGQQFGHSLSLDTDSMPHLSPVGQGNAMLFTPSSLGTGDEFDEYNDSAMGDDFTLYPPTTSSNSLSSTLFGEIPSSVAGFGTSATQDFMQQFYANATSNSLEWPDETAYSAQ